MPASELSRIAKWPKVPDCYGWISLDHRGRWRLKGELIMHAGLIDFISGHYAADDTGRWFVQNGPQRVFVALDYTPWVLRLEPDDRLTAHTGHPSAALDGVLLDEEGNVLLHSASGIGLLDDRDLPLFLAACRYADGAPATETAVLDVMAGGDGIFWRRLPLGAILRREVPERFRFQPAPAP